MAESDDPIRDLAKPSVGGFTQIMDSVIPLPAEGNELVAFEDLVYQGSRLGSIDEIEYGAPIQAENRSEPDDFQICLVTMNDGTHMIAKSSGLLSRGEFQEELQHYDRYRINGLKRRRVISDQWTVLDG